MRSLYFNKVNRFAKTQIDIDIKLQMKYGVSYQWMENTEKRLMTIFQASQRSQTMIFAATIKLMYDKPMYVFVTT